MMAQEGENWIRKVAEAQGYTFNKLGTEDIFIEKDVLGIVIEEKDWKDPARVNKNKLYVRGINGKWYYQKRSQVVQYGYRIKSEDMAKKIYRYIICIYVVSNLIGRRVQPIYFRKFGTIFVVNKEYFPMWLKSVERTYLGETGIETPSMYMGGK